MRGMFILGTGLVVRNNVTVKGAALILGRALRGQSGSIYMALVRGAYEPEVLLTSLVEPTIGVNGYARQEIASPSDWTGPVESDSCAYVASNEKTFAASGGDFDQAIRRVALLDHPTSNTANVLALSSPLPADLTIGPATPLVDRTFEYRLYL